MRQFNTDCEGPICVNDNAFELAQYFIPDGADFFTQISRYDDYLVEIARRPAYQPGYTLKLIVPFLLAYEATAEKIKDYSARHICYVPGAKETFHYLEEKKIPIFIVSTSYQQFALPLGEALGLPRENVYCTKLDLEGIRLAEGEAKRLKDFKLEIVGLPPLELPPKAVAMRDLSLETQGAVKRLDEIFWQEIPSMEIGKVYQEIQPIGGEEKAKAILDSLEKTGNELSDVIYVGDSITDVQAIRLVRDNGGLAISFNGNRYIINAAEIACISKNTVIITILVDLFVRQGREAVIEVVQNWSPTRLKEAGIQEALIEKLTAVQPVPIVKRIEYAEDELIARSEAFREEIRGELAGRLG